MNKKIAGDENIGTARTAARGTQKRYSEENMLRW
jgi:hypothetical protein